MDSSDNFCLRWNDFESNISSSFRELRETSEFFDVTLCCDNGTDTLQAHKIVLASCSPLFRRILAGNKHKNPLLYLKGIQLRELQAVLNFMYQGEVNVAQEFLNKFLAVAEELAVKGLTTNDGKKITYPTDEEDTPVPGRRLAKKAKRHSLGSGASSAKRKPEMDPSDDSAEVDIPHVKDDPDDGRDVHDDSELCGGDDYEGFGNFDGDVGDFDDSLAGGSGLGASGSEHKGYVMEEARFSKTCKGNALLVDSEGFRYVLNQRREKRLYWTCAIRHRNTKCKGSAVTEGFRIVKRGGHNHEPTLPKRNKYTDDF